MKQIIYITFFIFIQFVPNKVFGQLNAADSSLLSTICSEGLFMDYITYPGDWYWNHEINSIADLEQQIDNTYPFQNNDFLNSYQDIILDGDIIYDSLINTAINNFDTLYTADLFKIKDPFVKLKFSLYSKVGHANAILDSSTATTNTSTAYYIIPGTGASQLSAIIVDSVNYHTTNCRIQDHLKQFGDVYIAGTSNEDNRAIFFNNKKLNRYGATYPTYVQSYLQQNSKAIGVNKLIEIVAFVKYLKTKYDNVHVLGLSAGGTEALWTSVLTNPTSAIISSGYSILVDTDSLSLYLNSQFYYNYLQYFNKTTLYNYLANSTTKFLISQALFDTQLTQNDIDSSFTKNYFASLNNIFFDYNYYNHSFPPCNIIDSFLQKTILPTIPNSINTITKLNDLTYQNPINDNLKIDITNSMLLPSELVIYNSSGQLISKYSVKNSHVDIDMKNLPLGNYYIRLYNSQRNTSFKVIKN